MTSRQRLLCALRRGTPDRVPVAPFGMGRSDPESELGQQLIECTDIFLDVYCEGDAVLGRAARVHTETEGDQTITVYETPQGPLQSVRRRTAITSAQVKFACQSAEDADKILAMPYEPVQVDTHKYHYRSEKLGEKGLVMVSSGDGVNWVAEMFSPQDFCLLWADAPQKMIEFVEVATERLCYYYRQLCEAGVKALRIYGGEYVSVQLGPQAYQQLVVEPDRRLVDIIHEYDGITYFHNHGPMTRYYDQLLQIGIDAIDPLEAPPWGDCDIAEAKQRIGHRICLVGNLDDMEVLSKLPTETVLQMGRELINKAGPDGFILGGTAAGPYTELAARNFIALAELSAQMAG